MRKFALVWGLAALAVAAPAAAADFAFTGTFGGFQGCAFFGFTLTEAAPVTLRTLSFAGGTNAAGATIPGGGFDPVITLYGLPGGAFIAQDDDGSPVEDAEGFSRDALLTRTLAAGRYRVALTGYPNATSPDPQPLMPPLSAGFEYGCLPASASGDWFNPGDLPHYAIDVLNVAHASRYVPQNLANSRTYVPEPASWLLLVAGFGLAGTAMRRSRRLAPA